MKKTILLICVLFLFACKSKAPVNTTKEPRKILTYNPPKKANSKNDSSINDKKDSIDGSEKLENTRYTKVMITDVSSTKVNLAHNLGARLLESCSTSKFQPYTTKEVTQSVIDNTTVEKVSAVCRQINTRNGVFKSLTLLDITRDEDTDSYVFRYNIEFEKTYFQRELFVTINSEGKMSSLKTKEIPKKPM